MNCVCGHTVYAHVDGGDCMGCLPPGCSMFETPAQADEPSKAVKLTPYDGFYAGKRYTA